MAEEHKHKPSKYNASTKPLYAILIVSIIILVIVIVVMAVLIAKKPSQQPPVNNQTNQSNNQNQQQNQNIVNKTNETKNATPQYKFDRNGCYDSDSGKELLVKGFVIDRTGKRYDDFCNDTYRVTEYDCDAQGYVLFSAWQCSYKCYDGKCVSIEEWDKLFPTNDCFDSDYSDVYNKGYVRDTTQTTFWDYCKNTWTVVEYACNSFGFANFKESFCHFGCQDGLCLSQ